MFGLLAAARFVHFAAIALLFGLAVFPFYAIGPDEPPPRFDRWLNVCAAAALISGALVLAAMSANMGGSLASAVDPSVLLSAVTDTRFGQVWAARLGLAALLVGWRLRTRGSRDAVLLVGSGALLASVALTGHSAMPGGAIGLLHQFVDAAHLLAAGWWIGGLLALVLVARTLDERAAATLKRFSGVGYAAVAVIVATGVFKSAILVASFPALALSAYGRVLLLKIALFAGMGALALSNRLQITPALTRGEDPRPWLGRLGAQVAAEFGLGVLVLAVVGALGAMPPPVAQ